MAWNLRWVTIGNTIPSALFMAGAYGVHQESLRQPLPRKRCPPDQTVERHLTLDAPRTV